MNLNTTRRSFLATTLGATAAASLPAADSSLLRIAAIGTGGRIQPLIKNVLARGQRITALCDVDERQIANTKTTLGSAAKDVATFKNHRELLAGKTAVDAVIVATPDHWHYPICRDALAAGKHVYCEKPLTHTVEESRLLSQQAAKSPKLVTQLGNQGSASDNLRRSMELIQADLFGDIRNIHIWHPTSEPPTGASRPEGSDPVPDELDWDRWVGPAPSRPFKKDIYHPFRWRSWYDFGNGFIGDFCCHAFNLPVRALKLGYPERVTVKADRFGGEAFPANYTVRFHFAARGDLAPTVIHMHVGPDGGLTKATASLVKTFGELPRVGCLLIGDKGELSAGLWNTDCYVRLNNEAKFAGHAKHAAAKEIPESVPRSPGHMEEWIDACHGMGTCFSDFAFGARLTEIGLAGVIPVRTGRDIIWDGETMTAKGDEEATALARRVVRKGWD